MVLRCIFFLCYYSHRNFEKNTFKIPKLLKSRLHNKLLLALILNISVINCSLEVKNFKLKDILNF